MIDLKQFCCTEPLRPYIHDPYSYGEWTYATDGRILVRIARQNDIPTRDLPNNICKQSEEFFNQFVATDYKLLPKIKLPTPPSEKEECEACDGRGTEHECPDCECQCEECHGKGTIVPLESLSIALGNVILHARYLRILQELPSIEIDTSGESEKPVPFKFDGGSGLLMPMYGRARNHIDARYAP